MGGFRATHLLALAKTDCAGLKTARTLINLIPPRQEIRHGGLGPQAVKLGDSRFPTVILGRAA